MAKYDFNSSRYAKFFSSKTNQRILQDYLNTEGVLHTNYTWYTTQGRKATAPTPTAPNGTATFTVKGRDLHAAPLMDLRAPLADTNQMDAEGIEFYSASIPDFAAPGYVETAAEREARNKQFEMFGNDADIVAAWTEYVQMQQDSAQTTLNNLTAQLITTSKIDYRGLGRGIQAPLHKAPYPAANFVKAGDKVWTDPDCEILTQMAQIEQAYRDARSTSVSLIWQIPRAMFYNVFLANKQVKELVDSYKKNPMAWIAQATGTPVTSQLFERAVQDFPGVSPIKIVEERERNLTNTGDAFIQGWANDIAVLRPAGDAVEFEYTPVLDREMFEKYGASTITKVWASVLDGLATVVNTTTNNGIYKEWHTDLLMSACPASLLFRDTIVVKTSEAGANTPITT